MTKKPKKKPKGVKYEAKFKELKPGDDFYFEGIPAVNVAMAYAYFSIRGKYSIKREGKGYRFYLLKQGT